jgi:heme oxygenase
VFEPALSAPFRPTLPERLKSQTRELHLRAERSAVMRELLRGQIGRPAYAELLFSLRVVYAALESALQRWRPALRLLDAEVPDLQRTVALDADLASLGSPPAATGRVAVPAALGYAARLSSMDAAAAHRLLAHAYVRYLGDLHGGQILAPLVRDRFSLTEDGTRFYAFGDDHQVLQLRQQLRATLAGARLDALQSDEVVAEAVWAFDAHIRMFEQIRSRHPM